MADIRVVLVDDHPVVREGMATLLESQDDITVVGEAGSAAEAIRRIGYDSPDIVILDERLPDRSGSETCADILERFPTVKVLMLSSHADEEALHRAIVAGSSGFLLKALDSNAIIDAIRQVVAGKEVLDPALTSDLFHSIRHEGEGPSELKDLSDRERKVLELLGQGLSNRQIADEVYLAEKTVKNYVSNLLRKLDLRSRAEAATFAVRVFAEEQKEPESWH
jgi:DNA-binding NarL/FixJ family response regulator